MDYNRTAVGGSYLLRVPTTVFLVLGISRATAHSIGMIGCGLQLDDSMEYDWRETTVTLDLGNPHVCVFLRIKKIDFSTIPSGPPLIARVPILVMEEYVKCYFTIKSFLEDYRRNRFLRLGSRAFLDPWDLDSRDAFMLRLSDSSFEESFISDPRGQLLHSEIASKVGRFPPKQFREVPGIPDPGMGSWI